MTIRAARNRIEVSRGRHMTSDLAVERDTSLQGSTSRPTRVCWPANETQRRA